MRVDEIGRREKDAKDDIQSIFDIYKMNERIIGCYHCWTTEAMYRITETLYKMSTESRQ